MTAYLEFFPTHSDWILDSILEVEREALRYYFKYSPIHEVYAILTHIECSVDVIFCYVDASNSNDTTFSYYIYMYSREPEAYVSHLCPDHLLSFTKSYIEIGLEFLHVEDISLADTARLSRTYTEYAEFLIFSPFSDDSFDTRASYIYGDEVFS